MPVRDWILDYSLAELKVEMQTLGMKPFVASQIFQWVYRKGVLESEKWTNIGKSHLQRFAARFRIDVSPVLRETADSEGTRKFLIGLEDGQQVEAVLIREKNHHTFCISSQVGCPLACCFCATGSMGFRRNLTSGEILSQILILRNTLSGREGKLNLVFMGMGEPLLNYPNLKRALESITSDTGMSVSPRNITVSTAGILDGLRRLESDFPLVKIAFSLNASSQGMREKLMPVARKEKLGPILDHFRSHRRRHRITFEYVLIGGANDSAADARALCRMLRGIAAKINLIPYNSTPASPLRAPHPDAIDRFLEILHDCGFTAIVRRSKGQSIGSACGQLAIQSSKAETV